MAGVVDGQPVNASTTNAAFLEKNAADSMPFPLTLNNTATASGATVTDAQKEHNSIASFVGKALNGVYNLLPSWVTNNRGTSSDSLFARVKAIDTAFDPSTGHKHTGGAGDAPLIPASSISGAVSSATANTIALRDSSANTRVNNLIENFATTVTAAGTTTLTVSSAYIQQFTGTTTQTVVLPDATTLVVGMQFSILNRSTGIVTVNANGGSLVQAMAAGSQTVFTVTSVGTSAGVWDVSGSSAGGGALSISGTRASPNSITAVGGVSSTTNTRQLLRIKGSGGAVTVTASPAISSGTTDGQELILEGCDATNTVTINNGTGVEQNGAVILGLGDKIAYIWNAGASVWTETWRSLNA